MLEREAEFATDALRAALLEWAGYEAKVFEFISTEHTAKNLMIAAVKRRQRGDNDGEPAARVRDLAAFTGCKNSGWRRCWASSSQQKSVPSQRLRVMGNHKGTAY